MPEKVTSLPVKAKVLGTEVTRTKLLKPSGVVGLRTPLVSVRTPVRTELVVLTDKVPPQPLVAAEFRVRPWEKVFDPVSCKKPGPATVSLAVLATTASPMLLANSVEPVLL